MPRKPKRIPQTITEKEFYKITATLFKNPKRRKLPPYQKFTRIRNFMIFSLCFYLGLRPKESKDIKVEHINFSEKTLYIPAENNKQRNQDILPIPDFILRKIRSYLQLKNKFFKESAWLFPAKYSSNRNKNLSRGTLIKAWNDCLKKSGMLYKSYTDSNGKPRYNLTLYSLRHSFGTFSFEKLKDIKKVGSLLRHYDFQCRSTLRYIHTTQNSTRKNLFEEVYPLADIKKDFSRGVD